MPRLSSRDLWREQDEEAALLPTPYTLLRPPLVNGLPKGTPVSTETGKYCQVGDQPYFKGSPNVNTGADYATNRVEADRWLLLPYDSVVRDGDTIEVARTNRAGTTVMTEKYTVLKAWKDHSVSPHIMADCQRQENDAD